MLTTKPHFLAALAAQADEQIMTGVAMIGGYGLPNADDVQLLGSLSETVALWFLGDLDPPDLMVYAWVRAMLPLRRVEYLGIGDKLLDGFVPGVVGLGVPLSASEGNHSPSWSRPLPTCATR